MAAGGVPDAAGFARLALDLHGQPDVIAVLERVVAVAVAEIPGVRWAGVTLSDREGARTVAGSAPLVSAVDSLQYAMNEGPCLAVVSTSELVVSPDLQADDRWATFGARAREYGVRSILAVRMLADHGVVGALNLYSPVVGGLGPDTEAAAVPLAIHAGTALRSARAEANLRLSLDSRDVIGQAKGILMERHKLSAHDAFGLLTRVSQSRHRKVRDVAEHLASTGELLGVPSRLSVADGVGDAEGPSTGMAPDEVAG